MDTGAANLLLRYARATEISADRVGLLCCGHLTPAVSALFKISSGLTGVEPDRMLRSLRDQFNDLEQQLQSARTAAGWIRTHPMIPVRFKAMELAALDIIALHRKNPVFSDRGFRRIDQQIAAILEALDQCTP
jgi:Zn-dependent protease with chaperone function